MDAWLWPIVVTVGLALIGAFWKLFSRSNEKTQDKLIERLDEHIKEDIAAHERLRALEVDMVTMKGRVRDIGRSVHEAREAFRIAIAELYKFLSEKIIERLK